MLFLFKQTLMLPLLLELLAVARPTSQVTYSCNSNAACGCSTSPALVSKIVGGETAASNTWGWAVSLSLNDTWMCGASILSSSWILTAAHCLADIRPSEIIVSAATNELFGWKQWRYASSVIVHREYSSTTLENDIALIEVSPPFNMTDPGIAKICLPTSTTQDYPPINSTLVAIGWGTLTEDGSESETLQQVTIQRISYENTMCYPSVTNKSMQLCAGVQNGGKDTCQGDSGGPLMMFTSSQQWIIVGITSYGEGCARAEFAGVYTRVTYYLDWIRSMNVSDAITSTNETLNTNNTVTIITALSTNKTNATNDSVSRHQLISIPLFVAIIILIFIFFVF